MKRLLRYGLAAVVFVLMGRAANAAPGLQWGQCPHGARDGASAAAMRCGWLTTGARMAGQSVRLRVTRLQVRPDQTSRHPIIYVPGGPGDSGGQSVTALRRWRRFQQRAGWPRDLVIFDPRATGLSRPRPSCAATQSASSAAALASCFRALGRATAEKLGIKAQVADLHDLIAALGGGSAILWADSFGAVIARRLARRYPHAVRALVLDSPVLNAVSIGARRRAAFARVREQLIVACRRHLICRLAVPSAPAVVDGLLAALSASPQRLTVAQVPYRPRALTVDAKALRAMLLLSAYGADSRGAVMTRLRRALANSAALATLAPPLAALVGRSAQTAPIYWSSRCAMVPIAARGAHACRRWPLAPIQPIPQRGAVPTLVLAGIDDVLTPAKAAIRFVLARPSRQLVLVRDRGHGVMLGSPCARRAVRRFIISGGAWLGAPVCGAKSRAPTRALWTPR